MTNTDKQETKIHCYNSSLVVRTVFFCTCEIEPMEGWLRTKRHLHSQAQKHPLKNC